MIGTNCGPCGCGMVLRLQLLWRGKDPKISEIFNIGLLAQLTTEHSGPHSIGGVLHTSLVEKQQPHSTTSDMRGLGLAQLIT